MDRQLSKKLTVGLFVLAAIFSVLLGVCAGSVRIPLRSVLSVIFSHIFPVPSPVAVDKAIDTILWTLRLPRVIMAFIVGASLGVSGTVIQSVLRNPLASSYTIGVSAGASLGVGTLMLYHFQFSLLGIFGYPLTGCICAIAAITFVILFSQALDRDLSGNTIVLTGMVLSLFITALISLITSLNRSVLERLTFWQLGSFSMTGWAQTLTVLPIVLLLLIIIVFRAGELDILTFGDEQAALIGVNVKHQKWLLLYLGAALVGVSIGFVGIIGFVDLIAPHIVRKIFGAGHKIVLPMSALCGGILMTISDLIARTVLPASELPVGVVTSLLGAPFFAFVFFQKRRPPIR